MSASLHGQSRCLVIVEQQKNHLADNNKIQIVALAVTISFAKECL
jgi:hypothetical protein